MFLPYGTDTPIYYWPIATGVMIAVNILVFVLQVVALPDGGVDYALAHGEGLHPVQWVSSFFIHGGLMHLIGNMIFLWVFGLIIEGKVGPFLFVLLYLGIGISQNVMEQILFLPYPCGPSLGASSAIYGIMMVSLLWAPQENVKCMMMFWYHVFFVDVPIFMFGLVYFLWDFSSALFSGFSMDTALLHVLGAVTGVIPGVAFLLLYWVDGEQRDLISMFKELFGGKPLIKPKSRKDVEQAKLQKAQAVADRVNRLDRCWNSMDLHLNAGNVKAATELFRQMKKMDANVQWPEPMLLKVISLWQQKQDWSQTEIYSLEYLNFFQAKAIEIRLNLARLYLIHKESPRKAIKTIQGFDRSQLNEKQRQVVQQILQKSQAMIADGVMEVEEG